MKKILVCLPLIAFLSGCGVSSSDGVVTRSANSDNVFGLTDASDVSVTGESAVKNVNDVVIGSFKVGFVESGKQVNQAKGTFMKRAMGGNAKGNVKLEGVSSAEMQAVTEAAYRDFVGKLQAKGFNVVNRSQFTSSDDYANMSKDKYPMETDSSGFLSSYGKTVFYQPAAFGSEGISFANDIPKEQTGTGFLSGIQNTMSVRGDMKAASFAEESKVAVVSATYVVDFAAAGGHAGISSASVVVGQNLAVTQGSVKIISGGSDSFTNGTAVFALGQPVESGQSFGEVINDTSDADVAVQEVTNVASIFMGQGTNRSRDYIVKADPQKYMNYAADVLTKANDRLLSSIKK